MAELKKWTPAARMDGQSPKGYMVGKKDGHWVFASDSEACIAALEAQLATLTWTPISESNLPKVGDEVYSHLLNETRCVTESFLQMHGADPRVWNQYGGWDHFRPINPPSPERGAK